MLNISTRSVEIKRYRLEKINLKQGQNLTDYIISLRVFIDYINVW